MSKNILSVSMLNQQAKSLLEQRFALIWVEGEISNLARPNSGHIYFSLKDKQAQIRCALFKTRAQWIDCEMRTGLKVVVRAKVSLYPQRGEYQLIVEHVAQAGIGALQQAYEQLKQKLDSEGLFSLAHKRALPICPQRLGVITSPTGAAIHDVLAVLKHRFPALAVRIYPTSVQGAAAPVEIVRALRHANQRQDCDVLLLTRGGGSLEDLWAFNDEQVARAVFNSQLPVISAIGHEINVCIADFVADQHAPTPSAAAERISPNAVDWLNQVKLLELRLQSQIKGQLSHYRQQVDTLRARLQHPKQRLQNIGQHLDHLEQRLQQAMQQQMLGLQQRFDLTQKTLQTQHPKTHVKHLKQQHHRLSRALENAMQQHLQQQQHRWLQLSQQLDIVSPLATLQRGYAIASHAQTGKILRDAQQIQAGDNLHIRLGKGELNCVVKD